MPIENPEELTPVQQLLRMRRNQVPSEEFVEDFLMEFKERQRSELLRQSARGLFWERWTTYWQNRWMTRWALAGVAALLALGFGWALSLKSIDSQTGGQLVEKGGSAEKDLHADSDSLFAAEAIMIMGEDVDGVVEESPMLLSRHFSGGYADEAREVKAPVNPEGVPTEMSGRVEEQ
jgi:hypothetical protein